MARVKDLDFGVQLVGPLKGPSDGRGTTYAIGGTSIGRVISAEHEVVRPETREEIGEGRQAPAQAMPSKKQLQITASGADVVIIVAIVVAAVALYKLYAGRLAK